MNEPVLKPTPSIAGLARLSQPLGYRLSGDIVHLQARFTVLDPAAHQCSWRLQLWACPSAPTSANDLTGHIIAEVALPPMREAADDTEHLEMTALATPPAGNADHFMALVLVAGGPGTSSQVHDIVTFPCPERFVQPRMRGTVAYRMQGDRVHLSAEHIENPRDAANRSGTLALELWALATVYKGGVFQGVPLAGVVIGTLKGQTELTATSFELPFSRPPAGHWHFVMMLREWTAAGYLTRDFTNFNNPVIFNLPGPTTPPMSNALALVKTVKVDQKPTSDISPKAASVAIPGAAPATAKLILANERQSIAGTAIASKVAEVDESISINTAAADELITLQGISPKLAHAIIRKRPFTSLDELRRIRGITVKLLNKIRARLRL